MLDTTGSSVSGLYIHVPFCAHKCEYCAFYSEASQGQLISRYVDALVRELELVADGFRPATIFFGGGTPSLLSLKQWQQVLAAMDRLQLIPAMEWTIESNPATVSADKARLWREYGVNRISMGVQSFDPALLERLGRVHSREMVFRSFDVLRHGGFDNINIDLMFAIPGQTREIWQATLAEAFALQTEHLSCYEVIYEQDTPLYDQLQAGAFSVDEDLACAQYDDLVERSAQHGFMQYEIANFASTKRGLAEPNLPALAAQHNVNYWRGGSYHGLGPSAAGYVNGVRTRNWASTDIYCRQLEQGARPVESEEVLAPLRRAGEVAAFGLRMNAGWPFAEFRQAAGFDLQEHWSAEIKQLELRGWGKTEPDRFRLTTAGMRFADAAAELFLK